MKFQSSYESKKWAKIESSTKATIDKIKQGTATPEEINALGSAMKEYSNLASSLFDLAAQSIEASAEERIKLIELHRERMGKDGLTTDQVQALTEQAVNKGWSEQGLEIASMLEDSLMAEFSTVQSKLDLLLGKNEEQDEEDTDSLVEEEQKDKEVKTESKLDSILKLVTDISIDKEVKDLLDRISSQTTVTGEKVKALADVTVEEEDQADDLVNGRLDWAINLANKNVSRLDDINQKVDQLLERKSESIVNEGDDTSVINQNNGRLNDPQYLDNKRDQDELKDNVEEAATTQSSFLSKILQFLKLKKTDEQKDEESKASAWWRKFKGFFGDKWGAAKAGSLGLMAGLGVAAAKYLGMKLLNSDSWKQIDEYLSSHSLKEMSKDAWEYLKDQGKSLLGWLTKQFTDFFQFGHSEKDYANALSVEDRRKAGAIKAQNDPNSSDVTKANAKISEKQSDFRSDHIKRTQERNERDKNKSLWELLVGSTKKKTPDSGGGGSTTSVGGGGSPSITSSIPNIDASQQYNPSSIHNIDIKGGNTTPMDSSSPNSMGEAVEIGPNDVDRKSVPGLANNRGMNSMGLGSFGYSSSVDPTLGMMNVGILV